MTYIAFMDALRILTYMAEGQLNKERVHNRPLADLVGDVFERKAARGDRKLILESYMQKLDQLLQTLPKEKRDTIAIKIQKFFVKIGGYISEYGARITDFIRNIVLWPMIRATTDFPKDKYYQIELARAKAWGDFAKNTTKTATNERNTYRDYFLPTAATGAGILGVTGTVVGATAAGMLQGGLTGAAGGVVGAGIGAVAGGILGGVTSLALRYKDQIMGPPILYYSLFVHSKPTVSVDTQLPAELIKPLIGMN